MSNRPTSQPKTTLAQALDAARRRLEAAAIPDAALEADLLLRHTLFPLSLKGEGRGEGDRARSDQPPPVSRAYLLSHLKDPLAPDAATRYEAVLARRLAHEPSAYITGHREFYSLDFKVTPAVLIPRPETETLVEAAIELATPKIPSPLRERARARVIAPQRHQTPHPLTIADIGTGSGAIAVSLATALPNATLYATDVSPAALAVARENARRHAVEARIMFVTGDLLAPLPTTVDLLVANLPYVNAADWARLDAEIRDHEPRLALDGGADGLDLVRRLLDQAPAHLRPKGAVLLELGDRQADAATTATRARFPAAAISLRNDLGSRPRVLIIQT
jgi:release factor glutamine methyltransferase